jgi:hypothetical protein
VLGYILGDFLTNSSGHPGKHTFDGQPIKKDLFSPSRNPLKKILYKLRKNEMRSLTLKWVLCNVTHRYLVHTYVSMHVHIMLKIKRQYWNTKVISNIFDVVNVGSSSSGL